MPAFDVAIIGAGASGTTLAVHLARRRPQVRIALIDRSGFGRGLAYSTTHEVHVLNVPAAKMSALEKEPDHFLRWLGSRGLAAEPGTFAPRGLYGAYLEDLLEEASECALAHGGCIERIRNEAVAILPEGSGWGVSLANRTLIAKTAVLALGNLAPEPLPIAHLESLARRGVYFDSPWEPGALEPLARPGSILLIGAGLTAVDAALALCARGKSCELIALSRHGLVPMGHRETPSRSIDAWSRTLREVARQVRREAKQAAAQGLDWRNIIDALRPHTQTLWRGFSLEERRRFIRHLRHVWDAHRHRMAPEIAAAVERLRSSGRLEVRAGKLIDAVSIEAGARVQYRPRGATELVPLEVRRIINCTGPGRIARSKMPLIRSLLHEGLARVDALEMGFDVSVDGQLLDARGARVPGLFTLGPPRRGESWESTAMPEIRAQAAQLAQQLSA